MCVRAVSSAGTCAQHCHELAASRARQRAAGGCTLRARHGRRHGLHTCVPAAHWGCWLGRYDKVIRFSGLARSYTHTYRRALASHRAPAVHLHRLGTPPRASTHNCAPNLLHMLLPAHAWYCPDTACMHATTQNTGPSRRHACGPDMPANTARCGNSPMAHGAGAPRNTSSRPLPARQQLARGRAVVSSNLVAEADIVR
jgi:hypothetical protein